MMTFVLAAIMTVALGATSVFADGTTPHDISITSDTEQKENHTYEAYQVFVGTYDSTTGQLQNFSWGDGVDGEALLNELKTITAYANCTTAAQVAAVLNGKADDSDEAKQFAEIVAKHLDANKKHTSTGDKDNGYIINVTGDGYYFIKDTTASLVEGDTLSSFMLQVVGDVNVGAKDSTTESSKKVKDINDTNGTPTDWQDSADYDIGDKVPFKLIGTVADDYDKYTKYYFAFHDKEGTGLTFNISDVKVYVDGKEVTAGYQIVQNPEDNDTFDVIFEDLKTATIKDGHAAVAGSTVTVEYTSTLNANAVIGQKGNPNTSHIEFSNNPNADQQGTGRTPDDTVIVFTYRSTITKFDENNAALSGAVFKLYKQVTETYPNAKTGSTIKGTFGTNVKATALKNDSYYVEVAGATQGAVNNIFQFKGIDDGTYVFVETTIPSGYNPWEAVEFEVTATHKPEAEVDPLTGKEAGKNNYILTQLTGNPLFGEGKTGAITLEPEKADLDATIVNKSGSTLPSTGGIGTTIFYVLGGLLVAGAGIVLVARKKASE